MNEEYYNKIDIIIHTGLATGTPNTVYEAVASGAFAMGTKIGCMEELITNDVNGYLFDKPNISNKNTFGNNQEIINCSKQIVDKLLYLNNNREVIKNFAIKLRQNILNNWTWKKAQRLVTNFIIIFIIFSIKHIWSRLALYILNDLTSPMSKFFLRIYLIYLCI